MNYFSHYERLIVRAKGRVLDGIGKNQWLGKRQSQETRNRMSASRLAYFARAKNAAIYSSSPNF